MNSDNEWMSISDMMSGLMLIFMFIAISFMIQVQSDKEKLEINNNKLEALMIEAKKDKEKLEINNKELERLMKLAKQDKNKIKNIAKTYFKDKEELNKALNKEFVDDLKRWEAEITLDNTIVFNSPNVLFQNGKSQLKKDFKTILNDFFPRYISVLSSKEYKNEIDEIRIEGHTSNSWRKGLSTDLVYLKNMKLSQTRANNVLAYCYQIKMNSIYQNKVWLEKHFRANGMAFSKLKYLDINQTILDPIKSRRVEFRVQLKTEEKIYKILKVSN